MEAIITVIIVLLVCIVIWYISTSNGIKRSQLKVEEAESGIDVALTKRYDVLTKMLDVVKGYQAHEKTVLTELVKLRSGMTMAEKNAANQKMEQLTKDINILAENYPELKSSNNFMELQKTIADVEAQIVQCECQHVQYEACCIPEQHCSEQHACGKETILRGRGSKASGCEDEFLTK